MYICVLVDANKFNHENKLQRISHSFMSLVSNRRCIIRVAFCFFSHKCLLDRLIRLYKAIERI
nr:MAG TPA: hypothetical protein [Caudoviricetes sp.]